MNRTDGKDGTDAKKRDEMSAQVWALAAGIVEYMSEQIAEDQACTVAISVTALISALAVVAVSAKPAHKSREDVTDFVCARLRELMKARFDQEEAMELFK